MGQPDVACAAYPRPMFLYLHGFASSAGSGKAILFRDHLAASGVPLVIPELDEGDFEHLTISRQLALVNRLCAEHARPHVIIGSSLGGYVAALHASSHEVDALVLMAPAVDFARRIRVRYGADFDRWEQTGTTLVDHYGLGRKVPLAFDLMRDAVDHAPWPRVTAPTLIVQGLRDDIVPAGIVQQWARGQPDAQVRLFDSPHDLMDVTPALWTESRAFLQRLGLLP